MAVADAPFDLLDVKLAAPVARTDTVAKADLTARLRASSEPVVTVVAGAGYGKTTFLARWAEADPRPFAWVALDGREDEVQLLRYVAAAMHRIEPVADVVLEALSGPRASIWTTRVPRLISALSALERPLVLVLDDLHTVVNPRCLDVLSALLEYVPAGSQVAVVSREEPALPLARWRAQRRVCEIGVAELRLDDHEAGQLLSAAGTDLDAAAIAELNERTEGWPAGLYLAALSHRAGAPSSAGITDVAGHDRFVSDYFRLELLSRLPPEQSRFLQHTAVLERMCGALCDSVLQSAGSANELERLERTNCFVIPLDRKGEWYRYHHLFGELLRTELERSDPDTVASLNGRAMAWCIANDLPEEAIAYAHAAGEMDILAGLLDTLVLPLHYDGRTETVDEWLRWFTDEDLVRYPALAVYGAWIRALTGRPSEAERWLALAGGATSTIALSDGSATIEPWVATLRAHMMRDGVERALADAELALDQLPAGSPWVPTALLARGVAHALLGATECATEDLTAAVEKGLALGSAEEIYLAHAQLALLDAKRGAWGQAGARARAAQAVVDEAGLGDLSSSALAHVATARVALHEGRRADARAALTRTHRLRPLLDHSIPWVSVVVGLELTRVHLALAEAGAANTVLTEAEGILDLRPLTGTLEGDARELRARVAATTESAGAWAMTLTGAELRLLPYLATHLSFPEVASRLFISRNTVKTEAVSIYRKLSAASRSEAVERAVEVGLLESSIYPPQVDFTL